MVPHVWIERLARGERQEPRREPLRANEVTFGRDAELVLDPDDLYMSGVVGRFVRIGEGRWAVERVSEKNLIFIERNTHRGTIAVTEGWQLLESEDRVLIWTGKVYWALDCWLPPLPDLGPNGSKTLYPFSKVKIDARQRCFAAALCASRLAPERFPVDTTTNGQLEVILAAVSNDGTRLQPTRNALDVRYHRLHHSISTSLRELSIMTGKAGVVINFPSRSSLATFLVDNRIVVKADLDALPSAPDDRPDD